MDSFLHVGAVEIVVRPARKGRKSQLVPEIRTEISEVVEVEAGIDVVGCCNDIAPDIATRNSRIGGIW